MAEALLISRNDIVKFTALNGNIDTDSFIQWIKVAQDIHIQNYLGTNLLEKIKTDIINNTLANPNLTLLNTYVKTMLIHWAMVEYLPFSAYTSENATSVEKNEVDFLVEKERMIAQNYTERFITYINFNNSLFPEYSTNSNADMFPSTQNNFTGWYI